MFYKMQAMKKRKMFVLRKNIKYGSKLDPHNDPNYKSVYDFLKSVPEDLLDRASFVCQAYVRALMYLELSIKNNPESSRLQLAFLQKLYILLDEPDGVAGVAASHQEDPTLHDLILGHEATD
ncbi:serine/threonine-protein kinase ATR-like [Tachypleus tridentatus]|uniref:serine/threonine-protein kinase ATR-like n=1 Tax=Tachypleus tridentatus TaxID=6853 RepID=UPI003FD3A7E0